MGDRSEDAERFWHQCKTFFPPDAFQLSEEVEAELPSDRQWQSGQPGWTNKEELSPERKSRLRHRNLLDLRNSLREAWEVTDPRRKEWKLFELRQQFNQLVAATKQTMTEPPPQSGMDYALRWLWRMADKARRCANPDCNVTPYFLVGRRGRRFCSDVCARPAQQEYKQQWWEEHRVEMSKKRKAQYSKKQGRKRGRKGKQ